MSLSKLPTELLYEIAKSVDTDKDLASLACVSKTHSYLVDPKRSPVWFHRHARMFDTESALGKRKSTEVLASEYRNRRRMNGGGPPNSRITCCEAHRFGIEGSGNNLLQVINDSFTGCEPGEKSKNMALMRVIVNQAHLCDSIFTPAIAVPMPSPFQIVAIMFFHQMVDLRTRPEVHGYPDSQQVAYGDPQTFPLISQGGRVEPLYILHLLNLFKHHLIVAEDSPFVKAFAGLPWNLRPRAWDRKLQPEVLPLGRRWKGVEGFVQSSDEIDAIRSGEHRGRPIEDFLTGQHGQDPRFTDLDLSFDPWHQSRRQWPDDLVSQVNPFPTYTSSINGNAVEHMTLPFVGAQGHSNVTRLVCGTTTNLPKQSGICGWQRVCFVSYTNPYTTYTSNAAIGGLMQLEDQERILMNTRSRPAKKPRIQLTVKDSGYWSVIERDHPYNPPAEPEFDLSDDEDDVYDHDPVEDEDEGTENCPYKMWAHNRCPPEEFPTYDTTNIRLERSTSSKTMLQRCPLSPIVPAAVFKAREARAEARHKEAARRTEDLRKANATAYRRPNLAADVGIAPPATTLLQHMQQHQQQGKREVYVYQGVVLPGGKVMVGRWREMDEDNAAAVVRGEREFEGYGVGEEVESESRVVNCGPFLYWCVDD